MSTSIALTTRALKSITFVVLGFATLTFAQSPQHGMAPTTSAAPSTTAGQVPVLSKKMKGTYSAQFGISQPISNWWSIEISEQTAEGNLKGTLTFWGRRCISDGSAMVGRYDGKNLVVEAATTQCGKVSFTLVQNGDKFFGSFKLEDPPASAASNTADLAPN